MNLLGFSWQNTPDDFFLLIFFFISFAVNSEMIKKFHNVTEFALEKCKI